MSQDLLTFEPYYYNIRESQDQHGKSVHIRITANSKNEEIIMKQSLLIKKLKQQRTKHMKIIEERNFIIKQMVEKMKDCEQYIIQLTSNEAGPKMDVAQEYKISIQDDKKLRMKDNLDIFEKLSKLEKENHSLRKEIENLKNQTNIVDEKTTKSNKEETINSQIQQLREKLKRMKQKYIQLKKQKKQLKDSLNEVETIEIEQETIIFNEVECQTDKQEQKQSINEQNKIKESKINEQNQKIKYTQSLLSEKERIIEQLKVKIADFENLSSLKEKQAEELKQKLENFNINQTVLAEKEQEIEGLKQKIQEIQTTLVEKNEQMKSLSEQIQVQRSILEQKYSQELAQQTKEIMNHRIQEKEKEKQQPTQQKVKNGQNSTQKDKVIEELEKKLAKMKKRQRQLQKLKEANKKLAKDLQTLQFQQQITILHEVECQTDVSQSPSPAYKISQEISQQIGKLSTIQDYIQTDQINNNIQNNKINQYNKTIEQKDKQISNYLKIQEINKQLRSNLMKYQQLQKANQEKLQLQSKKIQQLLKENNILQKKLDEKQKQIEVSKPMIKQSIQVIENYQLEIKKKQIEINEKNEKINELENRVSTLNKSIQQFREESDAIMKSLKQRQQQNESEHPNLIQKIAQSENSIRKLTKEIYRIKSFLCVILNYAGFSEKQQEEILRIDDQEKLKESTSDVINRIMWKSIDQLHEDKNSPSEILMLGKQAKNVQGRKSDQQKLPITSQFGLNKQKTQMKIVEKLNSLQIVDLKKLPLLFIENQYDQSDDQNLNFKPLYISKENIKEREIATNSQLNTEQNGKERKGLKLPSLQIQTQEKVPPLKLPLMLAPSSPKNSVNLSPFLTRTQPYVDKNSKAQTSFLISNLQSLQKPELEDLLRNSIDKISKILQQIKTNPQIKQKNIKEIADNLSNGNLCEFFKNKEIVKCSLSNQH